MSKHTQGTWRVWFNDFDEYWELDTGDGTPSFGAITGWQEEHADNKANVDFIVKAVNSHEELLAVLKRVELGVFGSMIPNSDIEVCTRGTRAEVRAAIAKAEANTVTQ